MSYPAPSFSRPLRFPVFLLGLAVAAVSTGCVTTQLPPISMHGAEFQPLPDEEELWAETRAEEEEILSGFHVVYDPVLGDYLHRLAERLAPAGLLANPEIDLRITVLADPAPVAFSFPHGTILVHTGLLDRTVNEDQLAAVLAREIAHVEGRHLARRQRAKWNKQVAITALAFTAAAVLAVEEIDEAEEGDWVDAELYAEASEDVLFAGYELVRRVTAEGYGHKLEREADAGAVRLLLQRGYDPREALRFYESLRVEQQAGHLPLYAGSNDLERRIRSLRKSANASGGASDASPLLDAAGFQLVVRPRPYGSR